MGFRKTHRRTKKRGGSDQREDTKNIDELERKVQDARKKFEDARKKFEDAKYFLSIAKNNLDIAEDKLATAKAATSPSHIEKLQTKVDNLKRYIKEDERERETLHGDIARDETTEVINQYKEELADAEAELAAATKLASDTSGGKRRRTCHRRSNPKKEAKKSRRRRR